MLGGARASRANASFGGRSRASISSHVKESCWSQLAVQLRARTGSARHSMRGPSPHSCSRRAFIGSQFLHAHTLLHTAARRECRCPWPAGLPCLGTAQPCARRRHLGFKMALLLALLLALSAGATYVQAYPFLWCVCALERGNGGPPSCGGPAPMPPRTGVPERHIAARVALLCRIGRTDPATNGYARANPGCTEHPQRAYGEPAALLGRLQPSGISTGQSWTPRPLPICDGRLRGCSAGASRVLASFASQLRQAQVAGSPRDVTTQSPQTPLSHVKIV